MKLTTAFVCSVLCFSLQSRSYAKTTIETIPVIATDDQGNNQVIEVPKADYVSRLDRSATTVNDSLIEAFNATSSSQSTSWHLRTVGIGLGSTVEVGLGKFKLGATPRVRLLFTNSTTPSLP